MSVYGVIADVHGNLAALRAALAFCAERGVSRVLCLGDVVGYNAEPNACVDLVRGLGAVTVAGNHDRIAARELGFGRCGDQAAFALRRTRRTLGEGAGRFLAALPLGRLVEGDIYLTHGGVDDVCRYLRGAGAVAAEAALLGRRAPGVRLCLFGHTHERRLYEVRGGVAVERDTTGEVEVSARGAVFFLNPGSVDAARKSGERFAEVALLDASRRTASFHRVAYDHEGAEGRAAREGYRMAPADRWAYGAAKRARRAARGALARLGLRPPSPDGA
ncbi:MAG TPA: metallophosphoesterase family protein [Polyangiaceae bacterium]|nr:metallophosphoesterase family protein [Polyangiaceae bacterium]